MSNDPLFSHLTGVILAGGHSRRMGRDKRKILWDNETYLDRVCRLMVGLFGEVLVVTAKEDYDCSQLPVRLVTDKIPEKGSLGGLYTGLVEATQAYVFVVACDMPLLKTESISRICTHESGSDVVLVKLSTGLQTLHALYSKRCIPVIEKMLQVGDLKIQHLFGQSEITIKCIDESVFDDIDPQRQSFMNINSPADLEFVRKAFRIPLAAQ